MALIRALTGSSGGSGGNSYVLYGTSISDITNNISNFANLGFKPKKIVIINMGYNSSNYNVCIYDADVSTTKVTMYWNNTAPALLEMPRTIASVTDNGFTIQSNYASVWGAYNFIMATDC